MGKRTKALSEKQTAFVRSQKIFYVATAATQGRINLSPKGMDTLRISSPTEVIWLNLTGSGNETAAHLRSDPRMTLMFCAFEGAPLILRLYGKARTYYPGDDFWEEHIRQFAGFAGARQLIQLHIDLVQASCGMGVPYMDYKGEREMLEPWAREKGPEGMRAYREAKNTTSLDGLDTGLR